MFLQITRKLLAVKVLLRTGLVKSPCINNLFCNIGHRKATIQPLLLPALASSAPVLVNTKPAMQQLYNRLFFKMSRSPKNRFMPETQAGVGAAK